MNKSTFQAISYSQDFLTFLFLDQSTSAGIRGIFLFGSAARGNLSKESDIDLFIDCPAEEEEHIQKTAQAAALRFYHSKDFDKWKSFRFDHPLSIQAGDLATWELKTSIFAEGIPLYSKTPHLTPSQRMTVFTFRLPHRKKRYLTFIRKLFGRKDKGFRDTGLLGAAKGERIASTAILVPSENQQLIQDFFHKEKIDYSFKEFYLPG